MRRSMAIGFAVVISFSPVHAAGSSWGSPMYGDPPGWCTNHSDMWTATVVTNDPHVGTNPEQDTFYGFHPNPGYDDWYGYFYGDFRGTPGDASGWVKLLHEDYPLHYHWNFANFGWAVHGHAKEYIAYYNWTFGGECGIGRYGNGSPPPYMADQYGYPVVDIYVDSTPPSTPQPRVAAITSDSVSFTWDPVTDLGDGSGADYFASGMDHYTSWMTLGASTTPIQLAATTGVRTIMLSHLAPHEDACVHVSASDRLQNTTPIQVVCARALVPPPMPMWTELQSRIAANPWPLGLVGLGSWFWLEPAPRSLTVSEKLEGVDYSVTAVPMGVDWDFGDGAAAAFADASGFGRPYPEPSSVEHVYQAHSQDGYMVRAKVRYAMSWTAVVGGLQVGPYPLGDFTRQAAPLDYPVEQAQPVLIRI